MSANLTNSVNQLFGEKGVKSASIKEARKSFQQFESLVAALMVAQARPVMPLHTEAATFIERETYSNECVVGLAEAQIQPDIEIVEQAQKFLAREQLIPLNEGSYKKGKSSSTSCFDAAPRPLARVLMLRQSDKVTGERMFPEYVISSEQPFAEWAERFKDILAASDITDEGRKIAFLKVKLGGWARQRFDGLTAAQNDTLDHAIAALTPIFDTSDGQHAAMTKLKMFPPMLEGQCVMGYAEQLENLVKRALKGKTPEVISHRLLEEFLDRMPYNLAFYVREKAPATFQDALNHARKFDAIWTIPTRQANSPTPKVVNFSELAELKDEIRELRLEIQQYAMEDSDASGECFYCFDHGHEETECPNKKENKSKSHESSLQGRGENSAESESANSKRIRELEMRVEMLLNQNKALANKRQSLINVIRLREINSTETSVSKLVPLEDDWPTKILPMIEKG